MKKKNKDLVAALCIITAFVIWTVLVCLVDVDEVGPECSSVGFSTINIFIHKLTGVNMTLYNITDWLGLVPVAFAAGFGFLGLFQLIKRKNLKKVDYDVLVLGGFFIVVIIVYFLFEIIVINYRPVLINGCLETSYPSSTTMLVLSVMSVSVMQLNSRIKNNAVKRCVIGMILVFIAFMVIGRFCSGVHWISDIIGGALVSMGLVMLYRYFVNLK